MKGRFAGRWYHAIRARGNRDRGAVEPNPDITAAFALLATHGIGRVAFARMRVAVDRIGRDLPWLLESSTRERLAVLGDPVAPEVLLPERCGESERRHAKDWARQLDLARIPVRLRGAPGYPPDLDRFLGDAAPPFLCMLGDERWEAPQAGVVGARQAQARGLALARQCGAAFAEMGVSVVSGGADGVDLAAHRGAVLDGGRTVVVLPQGILGYTPPRWLWDAVRDGRGLIISEWLPTAPWSTAEAVTRNATISALSRAVCVIEPRKTGGSVRTARVALAQGKPVFVEAAPGARSVADALMHGGARPLADAEGRVSTDALRASVAQPPSDRGRQLDLPDQTDA